MTVKQIFVASLTSALCLASMAAHAEDCKTGFTATNPNSIYMVHGNGTVTDSRTGLMWKQCLEGQSGADCSVGNATGMTWADALAHAEGHTFADHSDWRLPDSRELESLVEHCRNAPAINKSYFLNQPFNPSSSSRVWSGSPYADNPNDAWGVDFNDGHVYYYNRSNNSHHVRLVRAGPSFAPLPTLSDIALSATDTEATVTATTDQTATGYWLVVPQGSDEPTAEQVKDPVNNGYSDPIAAQGSAAMTANEATSFTVTGLNAATAYGFYLVAEASGQLSGLAGPVPFTTAAASVAGVCGSASTIASATAPVDNLCSTGTATGVAGSNGQWAWGCDGLHGGTSTDANACTAPYASQTITGFTVNPASIQVGGSSILNATGGTSGNAVTYASNTPTVCSVSGSTVTGTAAGACTITASQAGTGDEGTNRYLAADPLSVEITVSLAPVHGACGTANGDTFTSAPSANLCGAGVESGVAGLGPWNWTCQGQHGGNDANCSANIQTYAITATANPTAGGSINCTSPVKHGGEATCTTEAEAGYQFSAWTGACEGQPSTCTLTGITTNQTSQAQFTKSALTALIPEGPQIGEPLTITPAPESNWVIAIADTSMTSSVDTTPPANVTLPHGLVNLKLVGGISGSDATVVLTYPEAFPEGTVYYKYGKTLDKPTDHWYEFSGAVISGNTITLTIKDGGEGDNDLSDNSEIDDPGGPAVPAAPVPAEVTPVPTLGQWALLLLASLLGVLGLQRMRTVKAR